MDHQSQISASDSVDNLSFASQESVLLESSENSENNVRFRKNDWLSEHFRFEKRSNNIVVVCIGCGHVDRNRGHNRMRRHLGECPKSKFKRGMSIAITDDRNRTTELFVKALIAAGWSFRGIETKEFKQFISRLTGSWKIPARQDVTSVYIVEMSEKFHAEFIQSLKMSSLLSLSVEFDHFKDATDRSFLGVMVTGNSGKRYLLDLIDVSLKGHFADVIVEDLVKSLSDIQPKSINSIVSDSASACKKARQDIIKLPEYKHLIQHRCLAHLINLVGAYMTDEKKNPLLFRFVAHATKITNIVRSNSYWSAYLKVLGKTKPQKACPTRWYSLYLMLVALQDLQHVIVEDIAFKVEPDKVNLIGTFDWNLLSDVIAVIGPLVHCIGHLERRDTSLGEAMRYIFEYARELFGAESLGNTGDSVRDDASNVNRIARRAFLHYLNEQYLGEEFGLFLAAYVLDRRSKMDFITVEGLKLCLKTISAISIKSGTRFNLVQCAMFVEFEDFKNFRGDYKMTEQKSSDWWKDRNGGGLLSTVGSRLANLKSSSTNLERTFSSVKYIQGGYRLSFSAKNLLHLVRMKIAMLEEQNNLKSRSQPQSDTPIQDEHLLSEYECSSVTAADEDVNWIEDEEIQVKKNFESFFKYIDFSIVNEIGLDEHVSFEEVTAEQISECVEARFRPVSPGDVIVDDLAAMIESTNGMECDANL